MPTTAEFMEAVRAAFAELPDAVQPTAQGFDVVIESVAVGDAAADGRREDRRAFEVVTDEATGEFRVAHRRAKVESVDAATRSMSGYRRRKASNRYRGSTWSMTFTRTPEGLVPKDDDLTASGPALERIRAAAMQTGWVEEAQSAAAPDPTALVSGLLSRSGGTLPRWLPVVAIAIPGVFILGVIVVLVVVATVFSRA